MRLSTLLLPLLATCCSLVMAEPAIGNAPVAAQEESRKAEMVQLVTQLVNTFVSGNYEEFVRLTDPNLTAFMMETIGDLVHGLDFHKFYFDHVLGRRIGNATILSPHVQFLGDDVAYIAYVRLDQFLDSDAKPHVRHTEETRIWHRRDGAWKYVHGHRSRTSNNNCPK